MESSRLPIKIKKVPGGYRLEFGNGLAKAYIYATDQQRVEPIAPSWEDAEALAKDVARTLRAAWTAE